MAENDRSKPVFSQQWLQIWEKAFDQSSQKIQRSHYIKKSGEQKHHRVQGIILHYIIFLLGMYLFFSTWFVIFFWRKHQGCRQLVFTYMKAAHKNKISEEKMKQK